MTSSSHTNMILLSLVAACLATTSSAYIFDEPEIMFPDLCENVNGDTRTPLTPDSCDSAYDAYPQPCEPCICDFDFDEECFCEQEVICELPCPQGECAERDFESLAEVQASSTYITTKQPLEPFQESVVCPIIPDVNINQRRGFCQPERALMEYFRIGASRLDEFVEFEVGWIVDWFTPAGTGTFIAKHRVALCVTARITHLVVLTIFLTSMVFDPTQ